MQLFVTQSQFAQIREAKLQVDDNQTDANKHADLVGILSAVCLDNQTFLGKGDYNSRLHRLGNPVDIVVIYGDSEDPLERAYVERIAKPEKKRDFVSD